MANFLVRWEIDSDDVSDAYAAVVEARAAQVRPDTLATVFTVMDKDTKQCHKIDLTNNSTEIIDSSMF